MSVSHLDTLAAVWIDKVHKDLASLVQIELSDELRQPNTSLSSLVPRIAESADSWLKRNDKNILKINNNKLKSRISGDIISKFINRRELVSLLFKELSVGLHRGFLL